MSSEVQAVQLYNSTQCTESTALHSKRTVPYQCILSLSVSALFLQSLPCWYAWYGSLCPDSRVWQYIQGQGIQAAVQDFCLDCVSCTPLVHLYQYQITRVVSGCQLYGLYPPGTPVPVPEYHSGNESNAFSCPWTSRGHTIYTHYTGVLSADSD